MKNQKLLDSALKFHREGNIDQADDIYKAILKSDKKNFDANHLHGLVLSQKKKHKEALGFLKEAFNQNSNNYELTNNLGIVYKNLQDYNNAQKLYLLAIKIDKNNYKAYFNYGNLCIDFKKYDQAIDFLKKSISYNDNFATAYQRLSEVYQLKYKIERDKELLIKSQEYSKKTIEINPLYYDAYVLLALSYLWMGKIKEANDVFKKHYSLFILDNNNLNNIIKKYLSDSYNLGLLIKHEYEQLTYIDNDLDGIRNMKFSKEYYEFLKKNYSSVINNSFNMEKIEYKNKIQLLQQLYNKPPKSFSNNLLNLNNDIKSIEHEYVNSNPEIVVIDNLLTPEALLSLQKFCNSANIFKRPYPNGYVGAFLSHGMSNEFLLKLSEDLRLTYKEIMKDYKLIQSWIFKHDTNQKGVITHADVAKVNVNLWISRQESNLSPKTGGLQIWKKIPPDDWSFGDYNYDINSKKMEELLKKDKAEKIQVPYKENRAVIFNSKLFHKTDRFDFKDNFTDRRLNLTFLYD